jgi:hypothetical protein
MKLSDYTPKPAKFQLKDPVTLEPILNDDGVEVEWEVVGHDSVEYQATQKDFLKKLEKMGDKSKDLKASDYKAQAVVQIAALVKGWDSQFNDFHGGEFSTKRVEEFLGNTDYGWLMHQLDSFIGSRKNFFVK